MGSCNKRKKLNEKSGNGYVAEDGVFSYEHFFKSLSKYCSARNTRTEPVKQKFCMKAKKRYRTPPLCRPEPDLGEQRQTPRTVLQSDTLSARQGLPHKPGHANFVSFLKKYFMLYLPQTCGLWWQWMISFSESHFFLPRRYLYKIQDLDPNNFRLLDWLLCTIIARDN